MPQLSEAVWRQGTTRLAQQAAAGVALAYAQMQAGGISEDEAIGVQAVKIAASQIAAVAFNDALLSTEMTRRLGQQFEPAGITWWEEPDAQTARLGKALGSVYGADVDYVGSDPDLKSKSVRSRLDRLAIGEVGDASQWSRDTAMMGHSDVIVGWYRRYGKEPCDFCKMMGGKPDASMYIHPVGHRMGKHPHCYCSQEWVTEVPVGGKMIGKSTKMKTVTPITPPAPVTPPNRTPLVLAKGAHPPAVADAIAKNRVMHAESSLKVATKERAALARTEATAVKARVALIKKLQREGKSAVQILDDKKFKELTKKVDRTGAALKKQDGVITRAKAELAMHKKNLADPAGRKAAFDALTPRDPMGIKDATKGVNPGFPDEGYKNNCTRCVTTYELRRRGYDVTALPSEFGSTIDEVTFGWVKADGSPMDDPDLGSWAAAEKEVLSWPVGARGFVNATWKSVDSAHIWNIQRVDTTPRGWRFIETQDGTGVFNDFFTDERVANIRPGTASVMRVDDLLPTQAVLDWVKPV